MTDTVKLSEAQWDALVQYMAALADRNQHGGSAEIYTMRQRMCAETCDAARKAFGLDGEEA